MIEHVVNVNVGHIKPQKASHPLACRGLFKLGVQLPKP